MSKVAIGIVLGSEHSSTYDSVGIISQNIEAVCVYEFENQANADAFVLGVDSATGWMECDQADAEFLIAAGFDPKCSAYIAFGEDGSIANETGFIEEFKFSTPDELSAFEKGIDVGIGWMDYSSVEGDSLQAYLAALEKNSGKTPTVQGFEIELKNGDLVCVSTYCKRNEFEAHLRNLMPYIQEIRNVTYDGSDFLDHKTEDDVRIEESLKALIKQ